MNVDLSQAVRGRVGFGSLVLQWVIHTERQAYRLSGLESSSDGSGLVLTTSQGEGWDGSLTDAIRASIHLLPRERSLQSRVQVRHPQRVSVVKTVMQGLPDGVLRTVGGEGGLRVGARHRAMEYPSEWATPFLWLQPDDPGSPRFVARCVADPIARRAFSARCRPAGDTELILYEETHAPRYGHGFEGSLWHLGPTQALLGELDAHGRELGRVRGLVPVEERPEASGWVRSCNLVVKMHGMDFNGLVHLDFDGMARALRELSRHGDLHRTLAHIVGWDGAYMRDCPSLCPAPELGGEAGLRQLVNTIHSLGGKVILHLNPVAATAARARAEGYAAAQAAGLDGEPDTYPAVDINNDGFIEGGWVLLNPWFADYRGHLVGHCRELLERYRLDGFYLADTHLFVGDPRGDYYCGWRALVDELRQIRRGIVLVAEGGADYVPALSPIFEPRCRADAPLFQLTIGRWGRSVAYSGTADAHNRAGVRELRHAQYRPLKGVSRNIIPAIALVRETLDGDLSDVFIGMEWARNWDALYGEDQREVVPTPGAAEVR